MLSALQVSRKAPPPPRNGARRWAEKSPANVFYFSEILDHFGADVRLIQIVRDGRDVTTSIHPDRPDEPWVSVRRWIEAVRTGLRFRSHPQVLTVRYRDLIQEFDETARRICVFLDEDYAPELQRWHEHARMRRSANLVGGAVGRIRATSIGKFESPDFPYRAIVDELVSNPDGFSLLNEYDFV